MISNSIFRPISRSVSSRLNASNRDVAELAKPLIDAPLNSALPANAQFSRPSGATVFDHEGVLHQCKVGEARFQGARRVENLFADSENLLANWGSVASSDLIDGSTGYLDGSVNNSRIFSTFAADQFACDVGEKYCFSICLWAEGENIGRQLIISINEMGSNFPSSIEVITLTDKPVRHAVSHEFGQSDNSAFQCRIREHNQTVQFNAKSWQVERHVLSTSEYVSAGVLPSGLYHGAGVDGVKYFDYLNENTVDENGVVIEKKGASIDSSYSNSAMFTNLLTNSVADFSSGWTATSAIVEQMHESGVLPGIRVESTGGSWNRFSSNAVSVQASISYTVDAFFKFGTAAKFRLTLRIHPAESHVTCVLGSEPYVSNAATGVVNIVSYQDMGGGLFRLRVAFTPSVYGSMLVGLGPGAVSGDCVAMAVQVTQGKAGGSFAVTDSTQITQSADSLSIATGYALSNFAVFIDAVPVMDGADYDDGTTDNLRLFGSIDSRGSANEVRSYQYEFSDDAAKPVVVGGGLAQRVPGHWLVAGQRLKLAFSYSQISATEFYVMIVKDGQLMHEGSYAGVLDHSNQAIEIGAWAGNVFDSQIHDFNVWDKSLTRSEMRALTL